MSSVLAFPKRHAFQTFRLSQKLEFKTSVSRPGLVKNANPRTTTETGDKRQLHGLIFL